MNKSISPILALVLLGCASITMPTGGPRDKTSPELVSSTPSANQLNFTGKFIELTFSEAIKLKDPKEEILIVPTAGKNVVYSVKKDKLIIEPELPWQTNTTYNINFREGVQDLTEGNPAEDLYLAFSTGSTIDSLSISGKIKDTFSEKIPTKITIALYQKDTFDIYKHTPTYFTKSDKEGLFTVTNLKPGEYYIYAFDDKNKNLKVDSKTEKFGFLSKTIALHDDVDSLEIPLTLIDSRPLAISNIRHTDKTTRIRFNKSLDELTINNLSSKESIYSYGTDQSELIFYNSFPTNDSIMVKLVAKDSLDQKIDTTFFLKHTELKSVQETFKTKEISFDYDITSKQITYVLSYNKPIKEITADSIRIKYDSLISVPIPPGNFLIDTLHNTLTIKAKVDDIMKDDKKNNKTPELILGKGSFISIDQDSTKRIARPITILKEEDLGIVSVNVNTITKDYIVQIITLDGKVARSVSNIKDYTFKNLEPLEYKIRIIIDENKNGKWDAGSFYEHREAEKIIIIKSDEGKYSFPLRANWELGPLLIKF